MRGGLRLLFCALLLTTTTVQAGNLYLERMEAVTSFPEGEEMHELIRRIDAHGQQAPRRLETPPFHHRTSREDRAVTLCRRCHGALPHRRSPARRAFLNQHAGRIDCLVCHLRPEGVPLTYLRPVADGPIEASHAGEAVAVPADAPAADRILERWEGAALSKEAKARLHHRLHEPLDREGTPCGECHGEPSLLDLQALGFTEEERWRIRENRIARFIDRVEEEAPPLQLRELLR